MESVMQRISEYIKWNQQDLYGMYAVLAALVFICVIVALRKRAAFLIAFIARMTAGCACIVLVNEILKYYHINTYVGINAISLLTSAVLGIPGVCLLYGLLFL